jgi:hypothetical protein
MSFSDEVEEMRYAFLVPEETFLKVCQKEYRKIIEMKSAQISEQQKKEIYSDFVYTFYNKTKLNIEPFFMRSEKGKPFKFRLLKDLGHSVDLDFYDKLNDPNENFFVICDSAAFDKCNSLNLVPLVYVNWD